VAGVPASLMTNRGWSIPKQILTETQASKFPPHPLSEFFPSVFFLGQFRKIEKKATIGFIMPARPTVRPSVGMEQFGSHWTEFH